MSLDPRGSGGVVTIHQENGSTIAFEPSGGYVGPSVYLATLVANRGGTWTLTRRQRDRFVFDAEGRLIRELDLNGETTLLAYNEAGKLATITDPAGRTFRLAYEGSFMRSLTDSTGRVVRYGYASGDLTTVTDARGQTWTYDYDGQHRLTRRVDPNRHLDVANTYDAADRVTRQTDADENVTQFAYRLGMTQIMSPERRVRQDWYASGQLVKRVDAVGTADASTWEYEYDASTHGTTKLTDPNGHVWRATYDAAGRRTSTTDPLEHTKAGRRTCTTTRSAQRAC
jgi:YD repeat-containing protein